MTPSVRPAILHVCIADKFIPPYIEFVRRHFDFAQHEFVMFGGEMDKYPAPAGQTSIWHCRGGWQWLRLVRRLNQAEKIIIHGLFNFRLVKLLALQPWLLRKCYWVMWGGDLYRYQQHQRTLAWKLHERLRHFVIRRMGHFITYVKGDYELARRWYGTQGIWHECFMYPSNGYQTHVMSQAQHDTRNIQVGNSADLTNNHLEILEKLIPFREQNIRIFVPLSYGDEKGYVARVVDYGKRHFGEKFQPILEFLTLEQYIAYLAQIDVAIFNHRRQQGMGNIITLLGLGKKVYMRRDVTSWATFSKLGVELYDVKSITLDPIDVKIAEQNSQRIADYFNEGNLCRQWKNIYEY